MQANLIDVDYVTEDEKAVIRLTLKKNRFKRFYDPSFEPYFYVDIGEENQGEVKQAARALEEFTAKDSEGKPVNVLRVDSEKKLLFGRERELLKVFCKHPTHVRMFRDKLGKFGVVYEADIPFARRYMINKRLRPFYKLDFDADDEKRIKKITGKKEDDVQLNTMAFDIETYNPQGMPRPSKDPVIMISYSTGEESGVLSFKENGTGFTEVLGSEEEMIKRFCELVKEKDVELLVGYNDAEFDLPYLRDRSTALKTDFTLGRDGKTGFSLRSRGLFKQARINGRLHVDVYPVVKFLALIGAVKSKRLTLEKVYEEFFGEKKEDVEKMRIWEYWENNKQRKTLAEYSLSDAEATKKIADEVLPLETELAKLVGAPLQEVCGATTGQLVEMLLMREAFAQGRVIPNKPSAEEAKKRSKNPVQGAYVKLPEAGIYDDIAVFDFRSLYPSIIISHNIDMDTLNCSCCSLEESHTAPSGHRFCSKKKGLIPSVLDELIQRRSKIKKELKKHDKDSEEYKKLFARSQALKIIANSFYGYLLYSRSRWYTRDGGESVTAYGRHYIKDTIKKAEGAGFKALYGDTDSCFLQLNGKTHEEAIAFLKSINKGLPEKMELELEGFYPRGVFVSKKTGKATGAKKKYALIGEDGRIKIRGFELVRRDWSKIAKETQRRVLEAILKEGSEEKAVSIVRDAIKLLKSGEAPLDDLVIYTQIRKKLNSYDIISPGVSAARKAVKAGTQVDAGAMVGYVITRKGNSISDKALVREMAGDYDADYYINNQVLPSVMKILKELGYSEEDLKTGGKQATLFGF